MRAAPGAAVASAALSSTSRTKKPPMISFDTYEGPADTMTLPALRILLAVALHPRPEAMSNFCSPASPLSCATGNPLAGPRRDAEP
jgi:hypothetical protein